MMLELLLLLVPRTLEQTRPANNKKQSFVVSGAAKFSSVFTLHPLGVREGAQWEGAIATDSIYCKWHRGLIKCV
ncbi:hypothetical protein ZHAS_00016171 [Anopheles sinensis]|uniref:Secreted protein n=1 Tax=Anopheles sinensis TaxID=74873 RepID=A0A084WCV5_ANOSI|nr:hypothetical protein ZHAS_00016171 [Anopheles sinensis]